MSGSFRRRRRRQEERPRNALAWTMDLTTFKATLEGNAPPRDLGPALEALWHEARGDWDAAHALAQDAAGAAGAWVHAYLHRKEGDASNAAYWYARAGRPVARGAFETEWASIAEALLRDR
jgi:hypothetical protein